MGRIITAIESQKRNPNRVNLHLDGEYAFSLSRIVAAWLTVGRDLSEAEIDKLKQDDCNEEVSQAALRFIAYKPRSSTEVRKRLMRANYPETAIEHTISHFTQTGLINDDKYAREWIEDRQIFHPRSTRQMEFELRRKGIQREVIERALDGTNNDDQMAYALASQKIDRYDSLEFPEFRNRLGGLLARRGFSYDIVTRVINRLWSERKTSTTQE